MLMQLDSLNEQFKFGSTSRAPRWAAALKFKAEVVFPPHSKLYISASGSLDHSYKNSSSGMLSIA